MKQNKSTLIMSKAILGVFLLIISLVLSGCIEKKTTITSNGDMTPVAGEDSSLGTTPNTSAPPSSISKTYVREKLGGTNTPYLVFNEQDYKQALADNKIILLYFQSDTCKVCVAEQEKIIYAFNKMDNLPIVGFRVDYNDVNTDDFEKSLATQFNVQMTHTKKVLKNGQEIRLLTTDWNKYDYYNYLTSYVDK